MCFKFFLNFSNSSLDSSLRVSPGRPPPPQVVIRAERSSQLSRADRDSSNSRDARVIRDSRAAAWHPRLLTGWPGLAIGSALTGPYGTTPSPRRLACLLLVSDVSTPQVISEELRHKRISSWPRQPPASSCSSHLLLSLSPLRFLSIPSRTMR